MFPVRSSNRFRRRSLWSLSLGLLAAMLLPAGTADALTLRFKAPHWLSIEGDHLPGRSIEVN